MINVLKKIIGTRNERIIKKIQERVVRINELEAKMQQLSDDALTAKTAEFRGRINNGESVDSLLPEAFATIREASRRVLGQRHYDVQLIGGTVLHQGQIAEMKTGEGKTLTATLPVYLHGLTGKGVHVVTVNDYLAKRDAEWMGRIYRFLGLTVGTIVHGLDDGQRRDSYNCDIIYGTNNEFGFDYLRDNMKTEVSRLVQRQFYFAIVDEVDSILIDEARTPLIISGAAEASLEYYPIANSAVTGLQKDSDYILDEKSRTVSLTEDGVSKLEKRLRIENLYDPRNIDLLHHANQALKAQIVFKKDVDYVVSQGKVVIVDEHTGRLMPGRRYSDGLHGALEAKEHVEVQNETQTLATITFQNFFRTYQILSGMTGTADTEAVEFKKIYNLDVVSIPTHRSTVRKDYPDIVYRTAREKFNAIAEEIETAQKRGQPVLVGTVSVEKSELVSQLLKKRSIPHQILNAKQHDREAAIIAEAGMRGKVTISTNMAGRGTDIVLGEGVADVGGLLVIGTERHESRRIDNQLRGRSGRQGDPGASKFFLSLEDDLMRIFASDRLSSLMARLGMEEGESIVSPMVTRAIERAQKRVEEHHFSSRKHLLEYDDVMNQQRQVVYSRRYEALVGTASVDFFEQTITATTRSILDRNSSEGDGASGLDREKVQSEIWGDLGLNINGTTLLDEGIGLDELADKVCQLGVAEFKGKFSKIPEEITKKIESYIYLQKIDQGWKDHLLAMDSLKDSVSLRGYGQRDPLQEYKKEAFTLFQTMWSRIELETVTTLLRMPAPQMNDVPVAEAPEPDQRSLNFQHEVSPHFEDERGSSQEQQATETDGLIYTGSRRQVDRSQEVRATPQTIRRDEAKVGRNDPCPCGSGKKFKKCHGTSQEFGAEIGP